MSTFTRSSDLCVSPITEYEDPLHFVWMQTLEWLSSPVFTKVESNMLDKCKASKFDLMLASDYTTQILPINLN